jgi:hypothetical protein
MQGPKPVMMVDGKTARRAFTGTRLLTAVCFMLVWLATFAVAQTGKRLVLKDGTWQDITRYELQGDRVRYFSPQRGEWEAVPKELIDWKATEEWNAKVEEKSSELSHFEADEERERKAEAANTLMAAPGLKLPSAGGVFVLDTFSGRPSLDELAQNESQRNLDAGRNRFPIDRKATIRQQFELKGPHARVQVHVPLPEIFVKINVDQEPNADEQHAKPIVAADRFRILRLEPTEASRVLGKVEVSVLGKQRQSQQFVSTRIESISGGWLKVIPVGNLDPGEYALVEMLGQNEFNSYVWDFGVDPKAPDNPNAEKPESPANEDDID